MVFQGWAAPLMGTEPNRGVCSLCGSNICACYPLVPKVPQVSSTSLPRSPCSSMTDTFTSCTFTSPQSSGGHHLNHDHKSRILPVRGLRLWDAKVWLRPCLAQPSLRSRRLPRCLRLHRRQGRLAENRRRDQTARTQSLWPKPLRRTNVGKAARKLQMGSQDNGNRQQGCDLNICRNSSQHSCHLLLCPQI